MKKSIVTLLISSILTLSACDDQSTTKLLAAEKNIVQLETSLKAKNAELQQAQQQIENLKQQAVKFPALEVKIVDLVNKESIIKHKKVPNDEYSREETNVKVFVSTAKTGFDWLDSLLLQSLFSNEANHQKAAVNEADVVAYYEKHFDENVRAAKEDQPIGLEDSIYSYYVGQRGNIATFTQLFYSYTGGAHGMYSTRYLNIDANKKAVICLNDLVPTQNQAKLKQRLWESYSYDRVDDQGRFNGFVGEKDFYISENFYFTPDGINFVYPPYALGPFAEGEVEIKVYFADLKNILNSDYYPMERKYIE